MMKFRDLLAEVSNTKTGVVEEFEDLTEGTDGDHLQAARDAQERAYAHSSSSHEHHAAMAEHHAHMLKHYKAAAERAKVESKLKKGHEAVVANVTKHFGTHFDHASSGKYAFNGKVRSSKRQELHDHLQKNGWHHTPPHSGDLGHTYKKGNHEISVSDKPDTASFHNVTVHTK